MLDENITNISISILPPHYSRKLNNQINQLHEKALRLVYKYKATHCELLQKDNSARVHHKNLQF